jgi:hypothetical protein
MITGLPLPPEAQTVLEEIMAASGVESCEVTSVTRSPETQARVMYDNLMGEGVGQGYAAQLALYKDPGREVIQVWFVNQSKARLQVIALMSDKIRQLGPENVSKHCSTTRWVWDVGPSSIQPGQHAAFAAAAVSHPKVTKFLQPPQDPAFHTEILR